MKTKAEVIAWIKSAINIINFTESHKKANAYIRLKLLFYKYHAPYIFSTKVFDFATILHHLESKEFIQPTKLVTGELFLSQYDRNFNLWMESLK